MSNQTRISVAQLRCLLLSTALLGCGVEGTPHDLPPDADRVSQGDMHYDEVMGTESLHRPISACELFTVSSRVGVFRFDEIIGTVDDEPGGPVPRIHVLAEAEETWFGDVENPLDLPFVGGHWNGYWAPPEVSARVGERVVLFMREGSVPISIEPQVFREVSPGLFSNGQMFVEAGIGLEELREIVTNVREGESCPYAEDFGFPVDEVPQHGADLDEGPADLDSMPPDAP